MLSSLQNLIKLEYHLVNTDLSLECLLSQTSSSLNLPPMLKSPNTHLNFFEKIQYICDLVQHFDQEFNVLYATCEQNRMQLDKSLLKIFYKSI